MFVLATVDSTLADVTLADKGKTRYRIVVPAAAIPSERYAAEELQRYLKRIIEAELPIVTDSEKPNAREVLLGDNSHLAKLRAKVDFAKLGPDGFILREVGNRLIIAGGRPRGTLNGVYTLLEEKLGVRWFTPELEVVPKLTRVRLPTLNETTVPVLENRDVFWRQFMRNADFAARPPHQQSGNEQSIDFVRALENAVDP